MTSIATVTYPGARRPDRHRWVDTHGVGIAVDEWGDADAPPLLLAHGGFDFAGTFDVFAPMLADGRLAGRVAGTSAATATPSTRALYSWDADLRDALAVLDSRHRRAGARSSGTRRAAASCCSWPTRCRTGVTHSSTSTGCRRRRNWPDVPDHERTRLLAGELAGVARPPPPASAPNERKPGTLDELAERRAA